MLEVADNVEKSVQSSVADTVNSKMDMKLMKMLNETTPPSQKISCIPNPLNGHFRKRKLFGDVNDQGDRSVTKNKSFSLADVYCRIFGASPPRCHRAEDDTETLIRCCLKFGQPLLEWFDRNSTTYRSVKPTYSQNQD